MIDQKGDGYVLIDLIELDNGRDGASNRIEGYTYAGVKEQPSTGLMALAIIKPGGSRRQFIEVGQIVALTINGERHELVVPKARGKVRGQEIVRIVEGRFSEDWAYDYFDPESPKYYGYSWIESLALQSLTREWVSLDLELDKKLSKRVQIEYEGRDGETVRVIKPISIAGDLTYTPPEFNITHITARCEMRKSTRTFQMSSIDRDITDVETGEVINKQDWAKSLPVNLEPIQALIKSRKDFAERFGISEVPAASENDDNAPLGRSRMDEAEFATAGKSTGCLVFFLAPIGLAVGYAGWLFG